MTLLCRETVAVDAFVVPAGITQLFIAFGFCLAGLLVARALHLCHGACAGSAARTLGFGERIAGF